MPVKSIQFSASKSDRLLVIHWVVKEVRTRLRKDPEAYIQRFQEPYGNLSGDELFALAAAHNLLGMSKETKKFCRLALQKSFGHVPSLYSLALKFFEESKIDEAKRSFLRAVRLDENAAENVIYVQSQLRALMTLPEATRWGLWCLEQLQASQKHSTGSQFELGKLLFERSEFEQAVSVLKPLLSYPEYAFEVTQYLSYIFERLYKGDELLEKSLDLAQLVKERSDLFFNLAMVCQHEQNRLDIALHFFYLAVRSDPQDPGLRFSLEQACLEYIGQHNSPKSAADHFNLMIAHLYHGSVAVAERYARSLRSRFEYKHPFTFYSFEPRGLWKDWLLKDDGILGEALQMWFGSVPSQSWKLNTKRFPSE